MSKHRPYKDERTFKNVIIGAYLRTGTFLDLRFFRPINYDEGTIAEYELCTLRARINGRLITDKIITGDLNAANGCLGSIKMECFMNRTPLGTTYEKVLIEFVPPIIANPVGYDAACNGVEYDAVYLQLEQTGRRFVLAKRDSKHLKLVEVTDMDENEIENTGQLATFPMDISKIEVFKRVEFGDCAEPNKGTASATAIKQEKVTENASKDELVDGQYVVITPDKGVTELSSIVQCVHTQYRLYGTKNDNVEFTLHVTNPHTHDNKSASFVINKRDNLIVDKHEMSFDECVCRINTLLTINTLNKSVVNTLIINTHGAFVIKFENGDCIEIDGAKKCRLVDGWNNY